LTVLRGLLDHHPDLQKSIDTALTEAERAASLSTRGLILNTALRKIWDALDPNPKAAKEAADSGKPKDKKADGKPRDDKSSGKGIPKDLLKDVKPADKKSKTEKIPFDKPAKAK
jgi:hypothetical protein